ncbi:MAG: hypothetical protein IJ679_04770 [Lachnospiraceae bacterium]|nr:hypothetical protein [Lachnospiraceae bacterium]
MKKRLITILTLATLALGVCAPCGEAFAKKQTKAKQVKQEKTYQFEDLKERYAMSADIKMNGYGDGFHSKLVFVARPECGISFGIQYDVDAHPPFKSNYALLVEDIYSNQPGGQFYFRPADVLLKPNKFYNLMMGLDNKGHFSVYFDHKKIASYYNGQIAGKLIYPRVEGCGKHNGDIVSTEFRNVDIKIGPYDLVELFTPHRIDTAPNIKSRIKNPSHVIIEGHLSDILPTQDWDSAYEQVSGIVQYNFEDIEDDDFDYGF